MTDDFGTLDDGVGRTGLTISAQDNGYLLTAAKWARFIGIFYLAILAIAVVAAVISGGAVLTGLGAGLGSEAALLGSLGIVFYLIVFAISIYFALTIYQFGTNTIKAINTGSQTALSDGLRALKNFFVFTGVILAIYLAITAFVILFGIIAAI